VDLGGKTLLPSFIDSHSHYINSLSVPPGRFAPPAGPATDVAAIVAELVKFRDSRSIPEGDLIIAYGYDESSMPDGRLLNRDDLDAAFPNQPVMVGHVSLHGGVLNSAAQKMFGYSAAKEATGRGIIVRRA
jgi:predicted amidohydrolase YtcJ